MHGFIRSFERSANQHRHLILQNGCSHSEISFNFKANTHCYLSGETVDICNRYVTSSFFVQVNGVPQYESLKSVTGFDDVIEVYVSSIADPGKLNGNMTTLNLTKARFSDWFCKHQIDSTVTIQKLDSGNWIHLNIIIFCVGYSNGQTNHVTI